MSIPSLRGFLSSKPSYDPFSGHSALIQLPADRDRYPIPVYMDGSDIVCYQAVGTAFGGPEDRGDDGRTASGLSTKQPGGLVGCALPMPAARHCIGTPLPQMPWKTPVEVTYQGNTVSVPLVDEGPGGGLPSRANIDLTVEAWCLLAKRSFDPGMVNYFSGIVEYRIRDGAHYAVDYRPYIPDDDGFPNASIPL